MSHWSSVISQRTPADWLRQDVRYAVRGLLRSPVFATTVILTFALGVGANAAIFSLIDPLLLRNPAGVAEPDRVRRVYYADRTAIPVPFFSGASYTAVRAALAGRARVAPKLGADSVSMVLGRGVETVAREFATSEYLPLLAGAPALGRFFSPDEADAAAPLPRAVLSHQLWQRAFGRDLGVVGKEIVLGPTSFTIVGVAPARFSGIDLSPTDVWTTAPYLARLPDAWYRWTMEKFGSMVIRVNPGVDDREIAARATAAYRQAMVTASPRDSVRTVLLGSIVEGRGPVASREVRTSTRVAGVAVIVLLVACANVATLSLVRATRRRREIAVRVALGAARGRLVTQFLTENLVLALVASGAAVIIAAWGGMALRTVLMPDVRFPIAALTWRVVFATLLLSAIAGALSGLVPALTASRPELTDALQSSSRVGPLRGATLRQTLLGAQAALSVVLLIGAGLFVRSLLNLHAIDVGLDPQRTIIGNLRPENATSHASLMEEFAARIRQVPGAERVALSTSAPFVHWDARDAFLPGTDTSVTLAGVRPAGMGVDTAFFGAAGLRILAGRGIVPDDAVGATRVVFVSETMAKALWPGASAVGQCLIPYARSNGCYTVAGVVSDLHQWALVEAPRMRFFVPLAQLAGANDLPTAVIVRATPERVTAVAAIVRDEMRRTFPTARIMWPAAPVADRLEPELRPWRVGAALFGALGAIALLVASIGVYSVIAYSFGQRTQEIGVRMALGAHTRDIRRLVLAEGLRVVAAGVAVGIGLALVLGRLIAPLLHGVSSRDPVSFVLSSLLLLGAGTVAGLLPAWKASRVDPVVSLRAE